MKFTDEELSRILSAHEGRQLACYGSIRNANKRCMLEAARNALIWTSSSLADVFDDGYDQSWTSAGFLRWLESQGVA